MIIFILRMEHSSEKTMNELIVEHYSALGVSCKLMDINEIYFSKRIKGEFIFYVNIAKIVWIVDWKGVR